MLSRMPVSILARRAAQVMTPVTLCLCAGADAHAGGIVDRLYVELQAGGSMEMTSSSMMREVNSIAMSISILA